MRGLLVRCLRARWDITARMTCPLAGGTVADDKYVFVARRLQGRQHDQLVAAGALEAVKSREDIRRLDPGRPDDELSGNEGPARKRYSSRADLRDLRRGVHAHAEIRQQLQPGIGKAFWQRR